MTDIHQIEQAIRQLLQQAPMQQDRLVSVTLPLTGICLDSLPQISDQRYFWMRPDKGQQWLGLGSAWSTEEHSGQHLDTLADSASDISSRIDHIDPEGCAIPPRLSLLSKVDSGQLTLPLIQLGCSPQGQQITVTPDPLEPDSWSQVLPRLQHALENTPEPPPGPPELTLHQQAPEAPVWMHLAEQAVRDLSNGHLSKLVLGRRVTLNAQRSLSAEHLVKALGVQHTQSTLFAADTGSGCWVGASPEVLLDIEGLHYYTEAVAGTVRRDPYETVDTELGEWLMRDRKNRYEHKLVVDSLYSALQPISHTLEMEEQPRLLKLRGLQHLHTPLRGELKTQIHPLQIAHELHPTPAVGGTPKQDAQEWLRLNEPLDRSWFTGLTGWIDTLGDASLNVVLRCAYLEQNRVDLYAGAGLVADSDSLSEWEETELKLGNMIKALQDA